MSGLTSLNPHEPVAEAHHGCPSFQGLERERKVPAAVWRSFLYFTGLSLMLYWFLDLSLDGALNDTNRIPTYWRAINLTTGVSPLVPLISLIAGLYGWFWYALQGLALFGEDRPQLPGADSLTDPSAEAGRSGRGASEDLLRNAQQGGGRPAD